MKTCTKCNVEKTVDEFYRDKSRADGRVFICKACHPGTPYRDQRAYSLKRRYGISEDEFDLMFETQEGRCRICGTDSPGGRNNRLHVDHDHKTGRVRGLLCHQCNTNLGVYETWVLKNEEAIRGYLR